MSEKKQNVKIESSKGPIPGFKGELQNKQSSSNLAESQPKMQEFQKTKPLGRIYAPGEEFKSAFPFGDFSKEHQSDEVLTPASKSKKSDKDTLKDASKETFMYAFIAVIIVVVFGLLSFLLYSKYFSSPDKMFDQSDEDKDGLTYEEEKKYGTDFQNADTDDDGYSDGDEVKNGYNPKGEGRLL